VHRARRRVQSAALPSSPDERREEIAGGVPSPLPPPGCHRRPRCPRVMDVCRSQDRIELIE
jgi:ABC-type dipeptide/oligopeptide/nickel transport system ATPase component